MNLFGSIGSAVSKLCIGRQSQFFQIEYNIVHINPSKRKQMLVVRTLCDPSSSV